MICAHNFIGTVSNGPIPGLRLNTLAYSAHPHEQEVYLKANTSIVVVGVEDVEVSDSILHMGMQTPISIIPGRSEMRTLTIVYLFQVNE